MFQTNLEELVELSVVGEVSHPPIWGYRIGTDGRARVLPGVGGVAYNVRVGMSAVRWKADHVEPGVTCQNTVKQYNASEEGFGVLSQIGNRAIVVSGDAKGGEGVVTGKHGGGGIFQNVMIDFDDATLDNILPGDKVLVRAFGLGLELTAHPDVTVMNMDPALIDKLGVREEGGRLVVPVHLTLPAALMGAGVGQTNNHAGDYDIQLFDPETVAEYRLDTLRLGDIVAMTDVDGRFGRWYHRDHLIIGVVVHTCSTVAGHGPGLTTLFTGHNRHLGYEISEKANLAFALNIGTERNRDNK